MKVVDKIDSLLNTLNWYSDARNWDNFYEDSRSGEFKVYPNSRSPIDRDGGRRARVALAEYYRSRKDAKQ